MAYGLLIVLMVVFPLWAIWGSLRYRLISSISPIVLCFAFGIVIRNFNIIPVDDRLVTYFRDGAILLALPLLLFSSDIQGWFRDAKKMLIAFAFCLIGGVSAACVGAVIFASDISDIWIPAGMMIGIHSGGTPNLFAVGVALGAEDEVFTLLNSAQIFWGAVHLLFLLTFGGKFYKLFLTISKIENVLDGSYEYLDYKSMTLSDVMIGVGITIGVVLFAVGISVILFENPVPTFIIITITSASILLSLVPRIRELKGTFETGDYFLLLFGIAAGLMSDFEALLSDGASYIAFVVVILIITIIIHLLLSKIFNVDRDTFIVTLAACIYGPVFIPQITRALENKSILVGGVAVSLIGLAIGNYLGIGVGRLLEFL